MIENEVTALEPIEPIIVGEITNIPLTDEERLEYNARTARIQDNFQQVARKSLEIWNDLQAIKDKRLFREKYDTYNDYCKHELGRDNSTIYRSLRDAKLKEELLLEAGTDEEKLSIMALKEGNTRFIRTLPEDIQVAFWKISFGVGTTVLPRKEDGSIEVTTSYLETVAEQIDEITEHGGLNLDGKFVPLDRVPHAAEAAGTDEDTVKVALMHLGISEAYLEALERQKEHIKEKSLKADNIIVKGTIETKMDINGSEYAILVDSKDNSVDLNDLLLSFNNRFVSLSLRSPIKDI